MENELSSLSEAELVKLYYQANKELKEQFLNKTSWDKQQNIINSLTSISKELSRRKSELIESLKVDSVSA